jgi:hypothetical protein
MDEILALRESLRQCSALYSLYELVDASLCAKILYESTNDNLKRELIRAIQRTDDPDLLNILAYIAEIFLKD